MRQDDRLLSKPGLNALKFRAPNGNIAWIVSVGAFEKYKQKAVAA
jgi:hypothetical protein